MAHPINALLSFYHVTEVEEWTCDNLVKKIGRQYWTGLKRITSSDSEFEASRREKAKEIINKWKEWTRSYSAFIGKDSTRMNMRVRTISSISQVNNLTGDSAQNFDNCRITSGKRDREETERASPRLNKKAFSSGSSMEGPDIRNYFSGTRSISDPEGLNHKISTNNLRLILENFNLLLTMKNSTSKIVSGKEFGEIDNEAHNDRTYNINYDQKPSNSGCVPKNDAVIYQDKSATIIYEQSYSPKEYTFSHYLGDFSKLARNSVDDLNYYFTRYANCTTATAKTFKSVSIHGYKYNVSVYVTDIIRIKTYRIYEVFSFRIPTSYSEGWNLFDIAKFGALLEELLINRQDVKSKMSKENVLNNNETDRVQNWISVPNNSPSKNNKKITDYILYKNYTNAIMPLSYIRQPFASLRGRKNNIFFLMITISQ
uniref:Uncharacterized protein n=1 Tax=Rhizophagus irregularis (strain DAOM 181602 / DAOM 197198 / MUCL 43194) TaxID=747089 RepID=U9T3A0_RHIID